MHRASIITEPVAKVLTGMVTMAHSIPNSKRFRTYVSSGDVVYKCVSTKLYNVGSLVEFKVYSGQVSYYGQVYAGSIL